MCGEYGRAAEYVTGLDGSSPRVWGIRDPSVCSLRPQSGSSPRVWGIHSTFILIIHCIRFIPTCVGNTRIRRLPPAVGAVHPHVCGEYGDTSVNTSSFAGSSPRVWGILLFRFSARSACTVHPHVCGEYVIAGLAGVKSARFIPTCVGNTACRMLRSLRLRGSSPRVWGILWRKSRRVSRRAVHPHVCGEYGYIPGKVFETTGSSPRVWGIRHPCPLFCAADPVHPHVCGEYFPFPLL